MEGSQEYLTAKRDKCIRFARETGDNDFKMSVEEMPCINHLYDLNIRTVYE